MFDIRKYRFFHVFSTILLLARKNILFFLFVFCMHSLVLFFKMYYYNTKQRAPYHNTLRASIGYEYATAK